MATPKQISANRRKARKSTGPQTKRGKKFSHLNALGHGLLAASVVLLPGEKREYRRSPLHGASAG